MLRCEWLFFVDIPLPPQPLNLSQIYPIHISFLSFFIDAAEESATSLTSVEFEHDVHAKLPFSLMESLLPLLLLLLLLLLPLP